MTKIKSTAEVRLSRDEAVALLRVANTILSDGDNGIPGTTTKLANRALQRMVECFGGEWGMNAGAVAHNLHRHTD